ncbi:MAG: LysR family transcriptional regulator [Chitinispirillia bacterium]|jgi:DNA-binding transcriptional LysR family regulator
MKPDFNRLHLFYQVFRYSSVAKAAKVLYITQSAVSQNLQKLEQELNITLFHRLPKRLVPTPAAERLYQFVMPFYSTLDINLQNIIYSESVPQGLLRIGAPPVFGAEFLPAVFAEFKRNYPAVNFQLTLGEQSVIANAYRRNELDIALVDIFGNRVEESWNLLKVPLTDEPLILVGSKDYVRQNINGEITVDALLKCQFIVYKSRAPELTEWFYHHFGTTVRSFDIVLTVENVHAVIRAVRNNLGMGIVPQYLVHTGIKKNEFEKIMLAKDDVRSRISLIYHPGRKSGVTEKLFLKLLRSKFN